jgi:flagellar biosynthesis protein FlhF
MLNTGFSPALSRRMVERLPPGKDVEQGLKWVQATLALNVRTPGDARNLVDDGGIYALVGPTGVGKTTTAAKLASRFVVKHGADKLALLTTDTYRIGGHEQLRIYGRLLGVPVHAVKDAEDLRITLSELRNKRLVLIDTVGMGQRDRLVAEQDAMLEGSGAAVRRILLLNATCNGSTLDDVATAFRAELAYGCILTKLDEAASLGIALDAVVRRGLILHYIANGQKVPEDLHLANAQYLVRSAFKMQLDASPFSLSEGELPLIASGLARQASGADAHVRLDFGARRA